MYGLCFIYYEIIMVIIGWLVVVAEEIKSYKVNWAFNEFVFVNVVFFESITWLGRLIYGNDTGKGIKNSG